MAITAAFKDKRCKTFNSGISSRAHPPNVWSRWSSFYMYCPLGSTFPGPILYPTNNLKKKQTNNETVGINKFTDKVANNI